MAESRLYPGSTSTGTRINSEFYPCCEHFSKISGRLRRQEYLENVGSLERFLEVVPVFVFYRDPNPGPNRDPDSLKIG